MGARSILRHLRRQQAQQDRLWTSSRLSRPWEAVDWPFGRLTASEEEDMARICEFIDVENDEMNPAHLLFADPLASR